MTVGELAMTLTTFNTVPCLSSKVKPSWLRGLLVSQPKGMSAGELVSQPDPPQAQVQS